MHINEAVELDLFGELADPAMELAMGDPAAPRNREGDVMVRGLHDCSHKYYCGVMKGKRLIPRSDGKCGPTNGPQCEACKAYQAMNPIEDQFAHLAMNPGQLLREARNPAQGVNDMLQDLDDQPLVSDDESVASEDPTYPERMNEDIVKRLVREHFPMDIQVIMNCCMIRKNF